MSSCDDFRTRLEHALTGAPDGSGLTELSWHEHLHACGACRALLEREEALEVLLATLPEPALPPDLVRRVLTMLARARTAEHRLDELLMLDREISAPPGLSDGVLAALTGARARDADLDRLLARVPDPVAPADLSERVLAGLAEARGRGRLRPLRLERVAGAAAIAAALGAWFWFGRAGGPEPGPERGAAVADAGPGGAARGGSAEDAEPPTDILVSLPVLENWDLLRGDDLDVLLAAIEADEDPLSAWDGDEVEGRPR